MEQLNSTKNQIFSTRPSFSSTELVRWSTESLFGCRRRFEKKIWMLFWLIWKISFPPCSSGTLWKLSHWSYIAGQRVDWNWNIPLRLPRWMHISIFILLPTMDWYLKVKIWAEDKQCFSHLLIQKMKVTETQNTLTSHYHVSRDTCKMHGRNIKIRYFGSILILESEKDWSSIRQDRMKLFFKEHSQPIVF